MTTRVLVPVDGSPMAMRALEHAVTTFPEASVTALHVNDFRESDLAEPMGDHPGEFEEWLERSREATEELFAEVQDAAADHAVEVTTDSTVGKAARSIVEYAEEGDFDQIVMGSHGRTGVARVLLGSVADAVARRAHCPVTVVR